jgi:hypothetical protein
MPVPHAMFPRWHALEAGAHAIPVMHALHEPLKHTIPLPHDVPFETFDPMSMHCDIPLAQEVIPTWHTLLLGMHETPAVHDTHAPALHTKFVPHDVPFAMLVIVSAHVDMPVAHDVAPTWHTLLGMHVSPATHVTQAPLLQTMSVPHVVPSGAVVPRSTHNGMPVVHDVDPL